MRGGLQIGGMPSPTGTLGMSSNAGHSSQEELTWHQDSGIRLVQPIVRRQIFESRDLDVLLTRSEAIV